MHTPVETLNLNDVEGVIKLMAGFAEEVKPDMKFIP